MPVPPGIIDLVNRFGEQSESYRSPTYNETQLRREFIDPFFKALGWDVDNRQGYAEAYKDVIHEDSIKIGGSTKAPDYSFRIGGTRKFFVGTKKPSVNIRMDVDPAFQLRRYAWSAKLPLSILTDFEELAVYDGRIKPDKNDNASMARTLFFTYKQYEEKWDDIAAIFSRDAILKGSFDKYAQSSKKKRGAAEFDAAFLDEIEQWRNELAKNIVRRSANLSQRELNTAVQKTIDRMIFLRICEDRGIERYGRLQSLLNGPKVYLRLCELFHEADHRYNSGLFHFDKFHFDKEKGRTEPPDQWTLALGIDDRVLKDILRKLYYPDSPYEFSVLSADILGQVYEQFLGKVIRLTQGHQAKVEDKPEVKKAGGVYYTPKYIVDYIVQNTVGKLIEGKAPHEIASRTQTTWKPAKRGRPLSVLDPACGSGSFLIGAYQYLLDWYRDWYVEHNRAKHKDRIYQTRNDEWRLTTDERKRILLDHIYGVDIDPQAVEVTKLSLLLKMLEGETEETLNRQLKLFAKQRALPDLAGNIKCGNSLIRPDFYHEQQLDLFDEEERLRINVFDWKAQFSHIFQGKKLGFDAVIGNPPYGAELNAQERNYLRSFQCGSTDTAALFVELSLNTFAPDGMIGKIIPKPFTYASNWKGLQKLAVPRLRRVIDCSKVWRQVKLEQCVVIFDKHASDDYVGGYRQGEVLCENGTHAKLLIEEFEFLPSSVGEEEIAVARMMKNRSVSLSRYAQNRRGAMLQKQLRNRGKYNVLGGKQLDRWSIHTSPKGRVALADIHDQKAYIVTKSVLVQNIVAHILNPTPHIKIVAVVPSESDCKSCVILDTINQLACGNRIAPEVLCSILNSQLINWYAYRFLFANAIRTMHFDEVTTRRLPLPMTIDDGISENLTSYVKHHIKLKQRIETAKTSHEQTALQRQIAATDRQIDRLVYQLYGLTDKEIAIVEEATG